MSLKSWTKRNFLNLKSGRKVWRFSSKKHQQSLVIEYSPKENDWIVTNDPWDIMAEKYYPAVGFGETLKEAMADFRKELASERKQFERE